MIKIKIAIKYIMDKLINNKRIVIVGPAPYLNKKKIGKLIDSYDVTIRFNKGMNLMKHPSIYGSKTDILYHCVCQKQDNGGKITRSMYNYIKMLVFSYPKLHKTDKTSFNNGNSHLFKNFPKSNSKMRIINKEYYIKMEKNIGCRPNTGIICILDLLQNFKPKEIYVTGFTFFKDGYSKLYRNKIDGKNVTEKKSTKIVLNRMINAGYKGRHNQWLIFKYFRNISNKYLNILKFDDILLDMFKFDLSKYKIKHKLFKKTDEMIFCHYLLN